MPEDPHGVAGRDGRAGVPSKGRESSASMGRIVPAAWKATSDGPAPKRRQVGPPVETRASLGPVPLSVRALSVLWVGGERDEAARLARGAGGPEELSIETVPTLDEARTRLRAAAYDVVLFGPAGADIADDTVAGLVGAARRTPVVVLREGQDEAAAMRTILSGASECVPATTPEEVFAVLRRAAARARAQAAIERAYAHEGDDAAALARLAPEQRALVFAEQRARISGLLGATFEGIAIHENGRILEVNDVFAELFGHASADLVGTDIFLLAAPEARRDVRRRVAARDKGPYETVGIRSDGTRFDLEVRGRSQTVGGRPLRVAAVRDVTQHKALLRRLAESEERHRLLAASATDLISRHDVGFRFLYASPAGFRLLGLEPTQLEGRSLFELVHPEDAPLLRRVQRAILAGEGEAIVQYRVRAEGGVEVWFETTIRAVLDETGRPAEIIAVSRDISARVRQERVVARLAAQNRMILESAGQGILGVNLKGNVTFLNPAAGRMLGVRARDIIGKPLHDVVHPGRRCGPGTGCTVPPAATGSAPAWTETEFLRRDGSPFPVHVVVSPVREQGETVGVVLVFDDITDRVRAEEALKARTEELEAFAYAVSHDLRTPIVSLDWLTQDLKERVPASETDIVETLDRMATNVAHADRLVRDLLDLAQISNERPLEEQVALSTLAREVVDGLREHIEARAISVDIGDLPVVLGPEPRLRQVLENLVGNAVKYVDHGGHVRLGRCDVRSDDGREWIVVEVEDDGPGVAPEYRERIFRLYERAPQPKDRAVTGSGVGLAIAHRVARRLEGDLMVTDGPLGGACFRFFLPPARIVERTD